MTQEELDQILDLHSKWLNEEPGGVRADLSEETLAGLDIRDRNLTNSVCFLTNFSQCLLENTNFTQAELRNAVFDDTDVISCTFIGANLDESSFLEAVVQNCDLTQASLIRSNFTGAYTLNLSASKTELKDAVIPPIELEGFIFDEVEVVDPENLELQ